ncbi:hypothetical protein ACSBR1_017021 [Camellia fascicularis]
MNGIVCLHSEFQDLLDMCVLQLSFLSQNVNIGLFISIFRVQMLVWNLLDVKKKMFVQFREFLSFDPSLYAGLWDRFPIARTVQQMMETMERMMEDPFVYTSEWPSLTLTETGGYSRGRTPWEIKEGEGEYKMRFNMPGMTKDDVKVYVEEKMLVVKAEKMTKDRNGQESEVENEEWSAKSQGRYSIRVALPENVEFEKIKAEVKDGVLYITIPKASGTSKVLDINVQ